MSCLAIEYLLTEKILIGIRGTTLPISKIIDIGTKVRGMEAPIEMSAKID